MIWFAIVYISFGIFFEVLCITYEIKTEEGDMYLDSLISSVVMNTLFWPFYLVLNLWILAGTVRIMKGKKL